MSDEGDANPWHPVQSPPPSHVPESALPEQSSLASHVPESALPAQSPTGPSVTTITAAIPTYLWARWRATCKVQRRPPTEVLIGLIEAYVRNSTFDKE